MVLFKIFIYNSQHLLFSLLFRCLLAVHQKGEKHSATQWKLFSLLVERVETVAMMLIMLKSQADGWIFTTQVEKKNIGVINFPHTCLWMETNLQSLVKLFLFLLWYLYILIDIWNDLLPYYFNLSGKTCALRIITLSLCYLFS